MRRVVHALRRNPVTAIMVVLGFAVAYNFLADTSNVSQSDLNKQKRRIDRIVKVIHVPGGVDVSNGNHSPSGQPGPAGDGGAPGSNGDNGGANGTNPGPGISPPPPSAPAGNGNNAIGNALNDTTDAVNDALHNTNCIVNGLLSQSC